MGSELCNRCGTCVGLSGGAIVFNDREGPYRPVLRKDLSDSEFTRIWNACPGKEFPFPYYRKQIYGKHSKFHIYMGAYENLSICHALDPDIRSRGASGGVLSATLVYLLEKKRIDGAIITRMAHQKPWLSEAFIATTREEILEGAQSKYTLTSVNEILDRSAVFKGTLAYVGLPGQVQSIRKLQEKNDPSVANIAYIFGPFYGNTLHFSSIKSFLRSHGEKDYRKIRKLYFRHGEWPGNMRVEMDSGRIIELKKFHANYLIPFHIVRNSLFCTDFTNEFTDISGGDAWAPEYEERGKGFSLLISRSAAGEELMQDMEKEGWITRRAISEKECIEMHSHGYDFKKRGSFIRIRFRKLFLKSTPDYAYTLSGFPIKRVLMELLISSLFLLLGTAPARWVSEQFAPGFIGNIFEKSRRTWKKSTHRIKRDQLN